MRINWKEVFKFLSGVFFVSAAGSWYLWWQQISIPAFGLTMSPEILGIRGIGHFALFLIFFYFGFMKKKK